MYRLEIFIWICVLSFAFVDVCAAQEACYPPGGVAGIVVATIIVTFVVGGLGVALAWRRWTRKTGNGGSEQSHHGQHQKQAQKSQGEFAFDNPYFKDQEGDGADTVDKGKARSSLNKNSIRSSKISEYSVKTKKPRNGKGHFMFGGGKKHRAYDDSCLAVEPERTVVSLRGHDFTGLGFNICGNMRDGIMVKDVLHRGPANESGLIKAGDKILNVTVSFTNIVYEDALTILSYASPYDVQLEIEKVPEKSRSTPSGSKRLGSCSFNNSGQKLFHPLYRSQSIDDLTQIDKDTFPSHGVGPRRSQSIGVAAHKLAAHFKNSDSKLEDKDRSPMSLVLSTTGSLNEKMLANVMSDGNLHKNGLQWEKRFEDTLEGEDTVSRNDKKCSGKNSKASHDIMTPSGNENASFKSEEISTVSQNYKQRNSKYLDSPYGKEKLEIHKSPIDKGDIDGSLSVQIHQPEKCADKRASAQVSGVLWQLDQSVRDDDKSVSNTDSPRYSQRSAVIKDAPQTATSRFSLREEGNESDVSRDSLEISSMQANGKKTKQYAPSSNEMKNASEKQNDSPSFASRSTQNESDRKYGTYNDNFQNASKSSENSTMCHTERVYANNVINKSMTAHNALSGSTELRQFMDNTSRTDSKEGNRHENDGVMYYNHREVTGKEVTHRNSPNSVNSKQKQTNSENCSQNPGNKTRITVNGDTNGLQSKLGYEASLQNNSPSDYKPYPSSSQRNDMDSRSNENKSKLNPVHQQVFMKKSANPAGMFTQINPFQMPPKQKNVNLKAWSGREEMNKQSPVHSNDLQQARSSYVTVTDSTVQHNRRSAVPEIHSYNQRMNDRTKTVLMSSYENSPYGSINSSQNANYKQHH